MVPTHSNGLFGGSKHFATFVAYPVRRRPILGGIAANLGLLATASHARAQAALSPDAALEKLIAGNERFVAKRLISFEEDLTILKQNAVAKQEPFAVVLSCADSRVPVELIFDQSIGHVFVSCVAGNICTPEIIASLEYGAIVLGTAAIVVLGHGGCGAVQATIEAKAVPGQITALDASIRPAVERAGRDLEGVIKANAQIQADLLRTASPVISDLIARGRIKVAAAYYDLGGGQVSLLP